MNTLIVFATIATMAFAAPFEQGVSLSQDTLGNYNLHYNTEDAQRKEEGFQDGKVIGSYSYADKEGVLHKITYVAAPNVGFTAQGDIPAPVQETPEVAAARAHHLAVVEKERALLPPLKEEQYVQEQVVLVPSHHQTFQLPQFDQHYVPNQHHHVDNTAELEAAKAEHFAAHKEALARLAAEYERLTKAF